MALYTERTNAHLTIVKDHTVSLVLEVTAKMQICKRLGKRISLKYFSQISVGGHWTVCTKFGRWGLCDKITCYCDVQICLRTPSGR